MTPTNPYIIQLKANDLHALLCSAVESFIQKPTGLILEWRMMADVISSYGIDFHIVMSAIIDEAVRKMLNNAIDRAQRYKSVVDEDDRTPNLDYANMLEIEPYSPAFVKCVDAINKVLPNR
jgi:hypothetical protein